MKRAVVSVMTTMLLVGAIVISAPAKAMPRVEATRGATITCRAIHVHVGGPPNTNLDHVTGYLRVDNWDTASGHDWRGFVRVREAISSVANVARRVYTVSRNDKVCAGDAPSGV